MVMTSYQDRGRTSTTSGDNESPEREDRNENDTSPKPVTSLDVDEKTGT